MIDKLHHKPFVFQNFSDAEPLQEKSTSFIQEQAPKLPVEPQEPVAPSFSEEELQAAQREAEVIGRQKGYEDAKREWDERALAREAQIIGLLENLTNRLEGEITQQQKQRASQQADMANIVLMIARKLVNNALDTQPINSVEPIVRECLAMLPGEAKLSIAVSEQLKEPLCAYLKMASHEGQTIEVIADPQMQAGDCRIQWPGGKAERQQEALWNEMENIVKRALAPSEKGNE
jgi:flagellar assembly protein FliH